MEENITGLQPKEQGSVELSPEQAKKIGRLIYTDLIDAALGLGRRDFSRLSPEDRKEAISKLQEKPLDEYIPQFVSETGLDINLVTPWLDETARKVAGDVMPGFRKNLKSVRDYGGDDKALRLQEGWGETVAAAEHILEQGLKAPLKDHQRLLAHNSDGGPGDLPRLRPPNSTPHL